MPDHNCFPYLEDIGGHASKCSECGFELLSYRKYLEDPKNLEAHKKHWPECKDCNENLK